MNPAPQVEIRGKDKGTCFHKSRETNHFLRTVASSETRDGRMVRAHQRNLGLG
jgi:hypothetical protein